jgi:hypothetical protein
MNEEELTNEDEQIEEELLEKEPLGPDLSEVINQLTGSWSYPGNWLSEIEIEPGDGPDLIVARDLAEQHWSRGDATLRVDYEDDVYRIKVDIFFDTGVSVGGVVSEDFNTLEWNNGTRWERR